MQLAFFGNFTQFMVCLFVRNLFHANLAHWVVRGLICRAWGSCAECTWFKTNCRTSLGQWVCVGHTSMNHFRANSGYWISATGCVPLFSEPGFDANLAGHRVFANAYVQWIFDKSLWCQLNTFLSVPIPTDSLLLMVANSYFATFRVLANS